MPLTPSTLITRALEGNPSFTKRGLILTAALVFKIQGNPGKKKIQSSPSKIEKQCPKLQGWTKRNITALELKELESQRATWLAGSCGRCRGLLRGCERGGMEGFREVLGVLHQLVGISDVCQAKPEDRPNPINEAAITMFKVPGQTDRAGVLECLKLVKYYGKNRFSCSLIRFWSKLTYGILHLHDVYNIHL